MGTMNVKENNDLSSTLSVFIVNCTWTHLKNLIKISILRYRTAQSVHCALTLGSSVAQTDLGQEQVKNQRQASLSCLRGRDVIKEVYVITTCLWVIVTIDTILMILIVVRKLDKEEMTNWCWFINNVPT